MAAPVKMRALRAALKLAGGSDGLAGRLNVSADEIEGWLSEESEMPEPVFLRIVDLVLDAWP